MSSFSFLIIHRWWHWELFTKHQQNQKKGNTSIENTKKYIMSISNDVFESKESEKERLLQSQQTVQMQANVNAEWITKIKSKKKAEFIMDYECSTYKLVKR